MNVLFLYVHTGLIWVANSLPEAYLNGVYKPQISSGITAREETKLWMALLSCSALPHTSFPPSTLNISRGTLKSWRPRKFRGRPWTFLPKVTPRSALWLVLGLYMGAATGSTAWTLLHQQWCCLHIWFYRTPVASHTWEHLVVRLL